MDKLGEVRDLGFLSWKDPDAWMEQMKGPRWNTLVREENKRLQETIKKYVEPSQIETFKKELAHAGRLYDLECFESGPIKITPNGMFNVKWRFEDEASTQRKEARDIYSDGKLVVYTYDIGEGAEKYELVVLDAKTRKTLWRRSPVGPTFSLVGDTIYYLGVTQKLWYNKLFKCSARSGNNPTELYEEKDGHYNLSLLRYDLTPYLVRENSGKTDTFTIEGANSSNAHLIPVKPGTERQLPYAQGSRVYYREADSYKGHFGEELHGTPYDINFNFLLTRKKGETTLYNHYGHNEYHIKQGSIQLDNYSRQSETLIRVDDGTQPPFCIDLYHRKKLIKHDDSFKLKAKKISGISADGTEVHGVILWKSLFTKPKALFAIGYGAYGVASSPAGCYGKWAPLIERGWGILYTYIRGGGDDTDSWAQSGRLEGRVHTRDDFLALVDSAQKMYKILATRTVIYGRSAGGFLMGMCLNKEPSGRLFGAVYTEVPYVDIIRTTTNPALPLTKMEYNEFGDPAHRPEDFGFLVDLSPADVAITTDAPNIFVIARTGLNDSEVYAYEPVKWINRIRKPGDKEEKVIGIAEGEGHFYSPAAAIQAKAEDLALLHYRIFHNSSA